MTKGTWPFTHGLTDTDQEVGRDPAMPDDCECDYDPEFHFFKNKRIGKWNDGKCHNPPADHGDVQTSPALCMSCLYGCAE